jgi:hypothetical protein
MSELTRTFEEAAVEATNLGLVIHLPRPNEVFVDFDSAEIPEAFNDRILELRRYDSQIKVIKTRSKSGNWHVRVLFNEDQVFTDAERIMWQAVLGSDPVREWLAAMRVMIAVEHPSIFFEKPDWRAE